MPRKIHPDDVVSRLKARTVYDPILLAAGIKAPIAKKKRQIDPAKRAAMVARLKKYTRGMNTVRGKASENLRLSVLRFMATREVKG